MVIMDELSQDNDLTRGTDEAEVGTQRWVKGSAYVYYEASATVITLILVGKYMEAVARGSWF